MLPPPAGTPPTTKQQPHQQHYGVARAFVVAPSGALRLLPNPFSNVQETEFPVPDPPRAKNLIIGGAGEWFINADPFFVNPSNPAGPDGIWGTADDFNLFSENSIMDLNLGGLMLRRADGGFDVKFSLERSTDLSSWESLENFQCFLEAGDDKTFLRLRGGPQ